MAPDLLGRVVQRGQVAIRLTEVEAYAGPGDPGSHAARGPTPRTRVMFGAPGHLYVYLSYGMHHCVNVVCGPDGEASAVLLRAGDVVAGAALARKRRDAGRARPCDERDLARGPACLGQALGLSRADSGEDACVDGATGFAVGEPVQPAMVRRGPRVGVSGPGGDGARYPWRWWVDGDPSVSAYRAAVRRVRTR